MPMPVSIDAKLPMIGLLGAAIMAAGVHYGVEMRVAVLSTKFEVMEKMDDEKKEFMKTFTDSLARLENAVIKVVGRLEKIEYRLDEVDKRLAKLA